jgi:hypothetical protein
MPLGVAIGQVFALYCPGGCNDHQFWQKKLVVVSEVAVFKLVLEMYETDTLLSSLKQQAS